MAAILNHCKSAVHFMNKSPFHVDEKNEEFTRTIGETSTLGLTASVTKAKFRDSYRLQFENIQSFGLLILNSYSYNYQNI